MKLKCRCALHVGALGGALLLLGVVPRVGAQGSRKDGMVFNTQGQPLGGATVRVCSSGATGHPCTPLASIYSNQALTLALANPLTADALGNYSFYATPGRYLIEIGGPGMVTKQTSDVVLPSDPISPTFTGRISCKNFENVRCVDPTNSAGWPGSDVGAWVNAAIADLGGHGEIRIASGTYSYSTTMNFLDGTTIRCAGPSGTTLAYTGNGVAVNMSAVTRGVFTDCGISVNDASAIGLAVAGTDNRIENFYITGASATLLHVTGYSGISQSDTVHIAQGKLDKFGFVGLQVDHAVDVFVSDVSIYSNGESTTAQPFVVDTGVSGLYVNAVATGWGQHGLTIRNSMGGGGPYNQSPIYLFFDQFLADTTTGGDAWLFDSTLGTNQLSAHFTNSWAAFAGHNSAGATITPGANGVHVSGGRGIYIGGGSRIRVNAGSGVLIDNANVSNVTLDGNFILANNTDAAPDQHGVYIDAAVEGVTISNNTIGNVIDSGGGQKYGIKAAAVLSDHLSFIGNNLGGNVSGTLLNNSTGTSYILANGPAASATANVLWGATILGGTNLSPINGGNNWIRGQQVIADGGSACTNSELALSAAWGSTASVSGVVGEGQTCEWTITSSGTGQTANPTVTDTLTNALPSSSVACDMRMTGGTGTATLIDQTTLSSTAPVFTFGGTPVAASTYRVLRRCGP